MEPIQANLLLNPVAVRRSGKVELDCPLSNWQEIAFSEMKKKYVHEILILVFFGGSLHIYKSEEVVHLSNYCIACTLLQAPFGHANL